MVAREVIWSGFCCNSMMAGLPLATARSKAGAKASSVVTTSPWAPKLRAKSAKSGLVSAVPEMRPGKVRS